MNITLYSISNYSQCSNHFIQNNAEIFHNIDFIQTLDKSYHFRIFSTQKKYIFFGDLDHFFEDIQIFIQDFKSFYLQKTFFLKNKISNTHKMILMLKEIVIIFLFLHFIQIFLL